MQPLLLLIMPSWSLQNSKHIMVRDGMHKYTRAIHTAVITCLNPVSSVSQAQSEVSFFGFELY